MLLEDEALWLQVMEVEGGSSGACGRSLPRITNACLKLTTRLETLIDLTCQAEFRNRNDNAAFLLSLKKMLVGICGGKLRVPYIGIYQLTSTRHLRRQTLCPRLLDSSTRLRSLDYPTICRHSNGREISIGSKRAQ